MCDACGSLPGRGSAGICGLTAAASSAPPTVLVPGPGAPAACGRVLAVVEQITSGRIDLSAGTMTQPMPAFGSNEHIQWDDELAHAGTSTALTKANTLVKAHLSFADLFSELSAQKFISTLRKVVQDCTSSQHCSGSEPGSLAGRHLAVRRLELVPSLVLAKKEAVTCPR